MRAAGFPPRLGQFLRWLAATAQYSPGLSSSRQSRTLSNAASPVPAEPAAEGGVIRSGLRRSPPRHVCPRPSCHYPSAVAARRGRGWYSAGGMKRQYRRPITTKTTRRAVTRPRMPSSSPIPATTPTSEGGISAPSPCRRWTAAGDGPVSCCDHRRRSARFARFPAGPGSARLEQAPRPLRPAAKRLAPKAAAGCAPARLGSPSAAASRLGEGADAKADRGRQQQQLGRRSRGRQGQAAESPTRRQQPAEARRPRAHADDQARRPAPATPPAAAPISHRRRSSRLDMKRRSRPARRRCHSRHQSSLHRRSSFLSLKALNGAFDRRPQRALRLVWRFARRCRIFSSPPPQAGSTSGDYPVPKWRALPLFILLAMRPPADRPQCVPGRWALQGRCSKSNPARVRA